MISVLVTAWGAMLIGQTEIAVGCLLGNLLFVIVVAICATPRVNWRVACVGLGLVGLLAWSGYNGFFSLAECVALGLLGLAVLFSQWQTLPKPQPQPGWIMVWYGLGLVLITSFIWWGLPRLATWWHVPRGCLAATLGAAIVGLPVMIKRRQTATVTGLVGSVFSSCLGLSTIGIWQGGINLTASMVAVVLPMLCVLAGVLLIVSYLAPNRRHVG